MNEASRDRAETSDRVYGGRSSAERVEERQQRLLAAALEVVGEQGFKAATVRAICGASGLSQRYYYEAFRDSEHMLVQLYEQQIERLERAIMGAIEACESPTPERLVRAGLRAVVTLSEQDPRLARVVFQEVLGVSRVVDAAYHQGTQRFIDLVLSVMRPFFPLDMPEGIDDEILAEAAVGGVVFVVTKWLITDFAADRDRIIESLAVAVTAMASVLLPES